MSFPQPYQPARVSPWLRVWLLTGPLCIMASQRFRRFRGDLWNWIRGRRFRTTGGAMGRCSDMFLYWHCADFSCSGVFYPNEAVSGKEYCQLPSYNSPDISTWRSVDQRRSGRVALALSVFLLTTYQARCSGTSKIIQPMIHPLNLISKNSKCWLEKSASWYL